MWLFLFVVSVALVALVLVARYANQKISRKLRKAGVKLSWGRISSTSVSSITVALDQGPLQCLTVDSICWGRAACSREAGSDSGSVNSTQQPARSSWLPIRIQGVRLVLTASGKSSSQKKKSGKQHKAQSAARTAAAWPAVSSALAVAKRLLPGMPIQLEDATVELKAQGLRLQLARAALHWAVNEEQSNLSSTLLLQHFTLAPGAPGEAAPSTSAAASLHCPVAQLTFSIGAGRGGFLPVSCSQLTLQVGLVKLTGASQLLLQAAAAMQVPCKGKAAQLSTQPPAGLASPQQQQQRQQQAQSAAATKQALSRSKTAANGPAALIDAVGLLPDKIKVGFAGAQLLPATAAEGIEALLGLPLLTGSIGAITFAASSCQRPAAVRAGEKLLSLSVGIGPVQVAAAGVGGGKQLDSTATPAAALNMAGLKTTADLVKAVDGSNAAVKHGPLRTALLNQQQKQQKQQYKASCTCTILPQVQAQVYAQRIPDLVRSLQLLQLSLKELKLRHEAAAAAVAAAAAAAATVPSHEHQEQLLPRVGSISPTLSLAGSRPDTPALGLSTSSTPQQPGSDASQISAEQTGVATAAPPAAGSTPSSAAGGSAPASPLAAAMQQRFPTFRQRGAAADVITSLLLEVTATAESGVSLEVLDSSDAVATWLSIKQLSGSASLEWTGGSSSGGGSTSSSNSGSGNASDKQQGSGSAAAGNAVSLGAVVGLQQLAVRVAGKQQQAAPAGRMPGSAAAAAAAAGTRQSMHQLLLLDALELRANSVEHSSNDTAALAAPPAANGQSSSMGLELTAAAGQLHVAPSDTCLSSLLLLAEQAYAAPPRKAGGGVTVQQATAISAFNAKKHRSKHKRVIVTAVDVTLQAAVITYTSSFPIVAYFAKPAAGQAVVKGVQSQLRVALAIVQLSLAPVHQQLAASLQTLQIGYETLGPTGPDMPPPQSVELLHMQGVEFRQYMRPNLQLLKAAVQQLRSDVHVDAAIAAAGMAEAALRQVAACAQHVQQRHAAGMAASAEQQAAVAAAVAAAVGTSSSSDEAEALVPNPCASAESQISFSAIAAGLLPSAGRPSSAELQVHGEAAAGAVPLDSVGLPPVPRSSFGGSTPFVQEQQQTKPVLALEARLQDVAVQLSVCDNDALMVQLELVKYSSVLEQAVLEKLRFSINERSVVQVPHLALHNVPGWLPPGAAAAAAACTSQRSSSPVRGSSVDAAAAAAAAATAGQPGHKLRSGSGEDPKGGKASYATPQQEFDCGTSTESIRFFDDGGVQNWQSIDDPIPSASLGSRRPAESKDAAQYARQTARQQAARERCKVPAAVAASTSSSSNSGNGTGAATPLSGINYARSAADSAAAGAMLCFEVYAERVLLSIPHDEAPGRIILVCETWAKAVKQVLMAEVRGIKASLGTIKTAKALIKSSSGSRPSSASAAKTSAGKKAKPAYLELTVHVQQLVFSLEQNPLETWMGLHGPVLQAMAAERHLTEQLLASCSAAHGKISRAAGSAAAAGAVSAAAASGAAAHTPAAAKKQRGRWRSLSRRGPAVTAAIAAGSVGDAAAAAVVGPVAAAMAALTPGGSALHSGLVGAHAAPNPAAPAPVAAAGAPKAADLGLPCEAPLSPRAVEGSVDAADAGATEADVPGTPTARAATEAAAGAFSDRADAEDTADGELTGSGAAIAGPDGDVASDSSDDLDSSDNEDEVELADPDALAAALPNSAAVLAGSAAHPPSGIVRVASVDLLPQQQQLMIDAPVQPGAAAEGLSEMQQAVLQAHRELFSIYKFRCRPLHAAAEDPYHHSRAVMHVALARAEAVVLICLPGHAASAAMASEVIERVDPSSQGVVMERFQSISLDVGLQDLVAHFGGVEEMASTIGSLGASGLLIRARQLCAPAQTSPMRMAVGLWHEADVPVVVKGTRPPMKMYTDIKAELDDVQGGFCPGLEAPFGQLNLAFKRLTVPNFLNPDGSVPPSRHPGLPWWDMMRYMWRGVASVRLRGLTAILANSQNPHVGLHDEKLALTAATLNVAVAAGKIDLATTNLSAFAHTAAPGAGPGDSLLVLPAFHLPFTTVSFTITTKLPGGRSALFHHAFPILSAAPGPDTKPQDIVDVFSLMKAEGWCLGIDIAVNSDKTPSVGGSAAAPGFGRAGAVPTAAAAAVLGGAAGSAAPSGVAAACWHYFQPYSLPHAFIGEFQIKYIMDMVDTLANPSIVVRLSRKLKPFYAKDRRPEAAEAAKAVAAVRAQIVPMPMLKQQVDISLTADVFRVHHDAQDSEDPSDMVYIALSSMRYMNSFTYSRFRRTVQFSNGSRLKDSMRQFMTSLSVEAYDMKIIKPQGDELSAMLRGVLRPSSVVRRTAGYSDQLNRVRQGTGPAAAGPGSPSRGSPLKGGSRLGAAAAAAVEDDGSDTPGFSQGLVAAAACFLLRQAPADGAAAAAQLAVKPGTIPIDPPPIPKRPIRMIAQDVKLLCPAELRDTCVLMFHHMAKAFGGITFGQPRGPVRISTQKQQQQATDSPRSGIVRTHSEGSDSLSRGSTGTQLQRHGSTDLGSSPAGLGDAGNASTAAGGGGQAAGTGSSSMVSTPLEEELMLQRILQENKAAAAGAVRKQSSRRRQDDLAARSTGTHDAGATAADGAAADDEPHAEGAGHAAVAARAVKGAPGAKGPVTVVAGCDDESASGSAVLSEDSSLPSSGDGASASPKKQQQQQSAGTFEEPLLEYEIEFVQVQVNLVSDNARGSLVLGTNSALLMGHLNPARMERSVSFKMDQVQAHVVCSEINPQQGPLWLEIANGKLCTPTGAEAIMRQVLLPFKCQLVTTKQATNSATAAALNSGASAAGSSATTSAQLQLQPQSQDRQGRRSSSSGLPPAGFAPSAAQELRLHVPNIVARLDSRQFEVLMDVIQNIAMAPLPTFPPSVRGMWQHPDGCSEDDDDQGVQFALESLQSLRERQRGLEKELAIVMQAHQQYMQLQQQYMQLAAQHQGRGAAQLALRSWNDAAAGSSYGDSEYSSYTAGSMQQGAGLSGLAAGAGRGPAGYAEMKEATVALVIALAAAATAVERPQQPHRPGLPALPASSSASSLAALAAAGRTASAASAVSLSRGQSGSTAGPLPDNLLLISESRTLVWWAQEQLQGAVDSITATRSVLAILRQEAGTFKVRQRNSMGVSITVDTIDWALSKGSTIIVQGELQGISYQSIRGEDHTGTTKIQLRTATFRDPKQQRQAAAAAAAADSTPSKLGRSSLTNLGNLIDSAAAGEGSSHRLGGAAGSSSSAAGPVQCSTPKAHSGSASGGGSAAAAEDAGIILAPWNPDESWEADELVRIYAIHGALEKRHVVYDHIEVMVHPIRVHLTAALAAALQDYFNLKDEDNKLVSGAAAKGASKQTAAKEDKRRVTAPGDLTSATQAGQPAAGSISAAAAVGPLTASAARKPSIFHRRVAAAAAAAASSSTAASPLSNAASSAALGAAQPQIVVPPLELEAGSHPLDANAAGFVTPVDSPAADISAGMPVPLLAAAGAEDSASTPADSTDASCSYYASSTAADPAAARQLTVSTPVPPSPGPCVQPVSADAALQMRYGTVMRSKAARAAGATTPSTSGPSTSAAAGGFAAVSGPSSAPGNGPGAIAVGHAGATDASGVGTSGTAGALTPVAVGTAAGTAAMPLTPGSSAGAGSAASMTAAAGRQVPVRSIKFKHVRFNRMHARLTWEGPPVNITGFGLVLDNRVYRNIDGGWKIVLNRYKWDAIRSLVKSMTGLQARKLKDLEIPAFGSDPADALELRTSSAWSNIKSIFKGRKGGGKLRLEGGLPSTDDSEAGVQRQGSAGGWEGGEAGEGSTGGADGGLGGGTECIDLMLDAARLKQKQKKLALLLGNVPPLPVAGVVW